jgi:putative colanic acid biosynthesis glycosyltransferase
MKIIQINCVYGDGSTGKIVKGLHTLLCKNGYESKVMFPFGSKRHKESGTITFSNVFLRKTNAIYVRLSGQKYGGAYIQTYRMLRVLRAEKPDLVHLHCINGYDINIFSLLNFLANNQIPTIFTLHAEFPYTGNCSHAFDCEKWKTGCGHCRNLKEATRSIFFDTTAQTWSKFKNCYEKFKPEQLVFTAVSPWMTLRAKQSPLIAGFHIETVLNGVDISAFHFVESYDLRKHLGISADEKILFHVTADFDPTTDNLKGAKYIIEIANKLKNQNIKILVAANYTTVSKLPDNVIFVGKIVSTQQLAKYYSMADLTLITSKRETFSMVTAESLCCGTPVVGFQAGGPESIALKDYSIFVPYGNIEALLIACGIWLKKSANVDKRVISNIACQTYSNDIRFQEYLSIYGKILF